MKKKIILSLLLFCFALSSCTTTTGKDQEKNNEVTIEQKEGYTDYENADEGFNMLYPSDWEMQEGLMGATVVFLAKNEASTDFRENVNIVVQDLSAQPMNLKEYTDLSLNQIQSFFGDVVIIKNEKVELDGQGAHQLVYSGKQDNLNLKWMQVWTVLNDKAYVFTYTAKEDTYDNFIKQAETMVKSFQFK